MGVSACSPVTPLAVAAHPWIGYEPLFLAQQLKGWPEGVELRPTGNATESLLAMQQGSVQVAALTLDEVLLARSQGLPLMVVLVCDVSSGADMLLAHPGLKQLADLRGKRIGVEAGAVGTLVLEAALAAGDISPNSVQRVQAPPDQQVAMWQRGMLDAVVTYEPTAAEIKKRGGRLLFDSRQMPDTIFDVLAALQPTLATHTDPLRRVVAAHLRGLEHVRTHTQDAVYRIAARQGVDPADVQAALRGVEMPQLSANRRYLGGPSPRLVSAAEPLARVMLRHGLLSQAASMQSLVTDRALPSAGGAV